MRQSENVNFGSVTAAAAADGGRRFKRISSIRKMFLSFEKSKVKNKFSWKYRGDLWFPHSLPLYLSYIFSFFLSFCYFFLFLSLSLSLCLTFSLSFSPFVTSFFLSHFLSFSPFLTFHNSFYFPDFKLKSRL